MKNKVLLFVSIPIIFLIFFFVFGKNQSHIFQESNILLTISAFLFTVFAGFFISRQGRRLTEVRQTLARFDGTLSFIYRSFSHFENRTQERIKEIISKHYKSILKTKSWKAHLEADSTTLTDIHKLLDQSFRNASLQNLHNNLLNRVVAALFEAQKDRKAMVALAHEHIPALQWVLIYLLAVLLLIALLFVTPPGPIIIITTLKAIFATVVVYVVVLLHQLDDLALFEETMGESSARDVLKNLT